MIPVYSSMNTAGTRGREGRVLLRSDVPPAITWQGPGLTLLGLGFGSMGSDSR